MFSDRYIYIYISENIFLGLCKLKYYSWLDLNQCKKVKEMSCSLNSISHIHDVKRIGALLEDLSGEQQDIVDQGELCLLSAWQCDMMSSMILCISKGKLIDKLLNLCETISKLMANTNRCTAKPSYRAGWVYSFLKTGYKDLYDCNCIFNVPRALQTSRAGPLVFYCSH